MLNMAVSVCPLHLVQSDLLSFIMEGNRLYIILVHNMQLAIFMRQSCSHIKEQCVFPVMEFKKATGGPPRSLTICSGTEERYEAVMLEELWSPPMG